MGYDIHWDTGFTPVFDRLQYAKTESGSVFAYSKRSKTGAGEGLGTRLVGCPLYVSGMHARLWKTLAPKERGYRLQYAKMEVFAYCKRSKTGAGEGLGTRLGQGSVPLFCSPGP